VATWKANEARDIDPSVARDPDDFPSPNRTPPKRQGSIHLDKLHEIAAAVEAGVAEIDKLYVIAEFTTASGASNARKRLGKYQGEWPELQDEFAWVLRTLRPDKSVTRTELWAGICRAD
jgi:hypothetical protein